MNGGGGVSPEQGKTGSMRFRMSPSQAVGLTLTANFVVWTLIIAVGVHYLT
jgi:hypothetical protein